MRHYATGCKKFTWLLFIAALFLSQSHVKASPPRFISSTSVASSARVDPTAQYLTEVTIDDTTLKPSLHVAGEARIQLDLMGNLVEASLWLQRNSTDARYAWSGFIVGYPQSTLVIVHNERGYRGTIVLDPMHQYTVRQTGATTGIVEKLDLSKRGLGQRADDTVTKPKSTALQRKKAGVHTKTASASIPSGEWVDDGRQIDVLVLYTGDVAEWAADPANGISPDTEADTAIRYLNGFLDEAGVNAQFRQVGPTTQVSYTANGNPSADLDWVSFLDNDEVLRLRYQYKADVVVMFNLRDAPGANPVCNTSEGVLGKATLPATMADFGWENAYVVVNIDCAARTGNWEMAHEIGHLLGLRHDYDQTLTPFPYGHGYAFGTTIDSVPHWRTIMAYEKSCWDHNNWFGVLVQVPCPRIPNFSTPDASYNGFPMGTPDAAGAKSSDAVRAIRESAPILAGYNTSIECTAANSNWTAPANLTTSTLPATQVSGAQVELPTPAGCWSVPVLDSSATWLSIASVQRPYVLLNALPNSGAARSAQIVIGTATVTITQAAPPPCTYGVTPPSFALVPASGASLNPFVATEPRCGYTLTSTASWLTLGPTSQGEKFGNNPLVATAAPNVGSARSAQLTVLPSDGGAAITRIVSQLAYCTYTVTAPVLTGLAASGATQSFTVSTPQPWCSFSVSNSIPQWASVTPVGNQTGTKTYTVTVAANTGVARSGQFTVTGSGFSRTIAASQVAPPVCGIGLSAVARSITSAGQAVSVGVTATAGCSWSATVQPDQFGWPQWMTLLSPVGTATGNQTVSLSVRANTGQAKTGRVNIGGATFTVNQAAAAACVGGFVTFTTTPTFCANAGAMTYSVPVQSCSQVVSSNASWLPATPDGCNADSAHPGWFYFNFRLDYGQNVSGVTRYATVTAPGYTFYINQPSL